MAKYNKTKDGLWMQGWWGKKGLNEAFDSLYRRIIYLITFFATFAFSVYFFILYTIFQSEQGGDVSTKIISSLLILLPLFLIFALVLLPMVWRLHLLRRDQNKVWAMIEDIKDKEDMIKALENLPKVIDAKKEKSFFRRSLDWLTIATQLSVTISVLIYAIKFIIDAF